MRGMQVLVQVLLQELWEPTLWATCFATKPQDLRGAATVSYTHLTLPTKLL